MGERRGTKALELWCRRITEGYPGVSVQNMTTSWKDGLAFCAMIHHFRPDLIDFDSLNKNDVYGNNELAFRIAEQHLGIPALLDAEDMASCSVPDRLSILTYLSQFYQTFGGSSPTRVPVSRATDAMEEKIAQVPESSKEKEASSCSGMRKDHCAVCGLPIFLAEKLVLARVAYHRTCFRCARCSNQLTPGNYYETEEGQFCCETCPDEEILSSSVRDLEESVTNSGTENDDHDSSSKLSGSDDDNIIKPTLPNDPTKRYDHDSPVPDIIAQTSRLRLNFIANQLLSEETDNSVSECDNHLTNHSSNLNTESPNSVSAINHGGEEKKGECDRLAASLDLESRLDEESVGEENSRGLVQGQSGIEGSPHKSVLRSDDKERGPSSLVQERLKLFESRTDRFENKKYDRGVKTFKSEVHAKKRDDPTCPVTTKTVVDQVDASESPNSESLGAAGSVQVLSHEVPNLLTVPEDSTPSASEEKSNEDDTRVDLASDTVATNVSDNEDYPEDLNPFNVDEEEKTVDSKDVSKTSGNSTNPFGEEEEEEKEEEIVKKTEFVPPKPATRVNVGSAKANELTDKPAKRRLVAPHINLNPFWSDDDDHDSDLEPAGKTATPVPKPRTFKSIQEIGMSEGRLNRSHNDLYASNSSLKSTETSISSGGTYRKKKQAPLPPNMTEPSVSDQRTPFKSRNVSTGYHDSPTHSTPKARKTKPAPPPPIATTSTSEQSPMSKAANNENSLLWEDQKTNKDEANRNRQSFGQVSCDEYKPYLDKSVEGKWKRKKGPAPPCPIPHRRKIKVMSLKDVKMELDEIEMQQQGLEKQGVRLEQLIRSKCESGPRNNDASLGTDVEELVLELFALVNEKNELFRRQAELMLLRRQQRLEEEHAEIEYQIRCLMSRHESTKTDFDKQKEEALIQRLVEIVEKRNEIVDCLEMDRRREIEEDRSINRHMDLFAAKNKNESMNNEVSEKKKRKQSKSKEKTKEKKLKKTFKKDIDKDVDEIELTLKRHTKRRWF
ncbi:MICAL-like protein 1 isoform X2 [Ceratina calcarata]|uniref:MICAL-like protein 1 isoform X2 n=1 Tax=Ceratina calcarata TaxID=156304 RepID=A0AAJ7IXE6_9HYME|nr:MICAL-like protein 1 isoform X2 [Ceratina calcarata]